MLKLDKKTIILLSAMLVLIILFTCLLRVPLQFTREKASTNTDGTPIVKDVPAGAYLNMGDCAIFVAVSLLGPWGVVIAGVGSCLADLFVGSFSYALGSLFIKAIMALVAMFFLKKEHTFVNLIKLAGYSGLTMLVLYFMYDCFILGDYSVAALSLPFNALQVAANGIVAVLALKMLSGLSYSKRSNYDV